MPPLRRAPGTTLSALESPWVREAGVGGLHQPQVPSSLGGAPSQTPSSFPAWETG